MKYYILCKYIINYKGPWDVILLHAVIHERFLENSQIVENLVSEEPVSLEWDIHLNTLSRRFEQSYDSRSENQRSLNGYGTWRSSVWITFLINLFHNFEYILNYSILNSRFLHLPNWYIYVREIMSSLIVR